MKLSRLIKNARRRKRLTLRQLQGMTGVGYVVLNRMETGEIREPSFRKVIKVAAALEIPFETLAVSE